MKYRNRALTIFLADLTHTGRGLATDKMPLGIGLLASYALKCFGADVKIQLFKYPDRFLHAVQHEKYDVVGCSTFNWNNNLSEWACQVAKAYNPAAITIRGGYNFPLDIDQQEQYMRQHVYTDIYCRFEGEIVFCKLIERLLGDFGHWNRESLPNCVFLNKETNSLIAGGLLPRIKELDQIPSPYVTGLMDQFFDGRLAPMIETNRGCPFSCDFCNSSNDYYDKMAFFSVDYVREELHYIARQIQPTGISELTLCDLNFGMYKRDKEVGDAIKECQDKYKWPMNVLMTTGKNNVQRVIQNIEMLGETTTFGMAVQSMNQTTLENIQRSNISLSAYKEMSEISQQKGMPQATALIVPLPGETCATYMKGIEELLDAGAKKLHTHTLQLNYGTIYKNPVYRKTHGYEDNTFYRLIAYDFGVYGDKKVFDVEEVATASKYMTFQEYLEIRKLVLVIEALYNRGMFREVFKFLNENGVTSYRYVLEVLNNIHAADTHIRQCFESFCCDSKGELFKTEEELVEFYSRPENYEALETGEIGGNVLFKHMGKIVGNYMAWVDYVFGCASTLLERRNASANEVGGRGVEISMEPVRSFVTARLEGVFDGTRTSEDVILHLDYDMLDWAKDNDGKLLHDFKTNGKSFGFRFYFDDKQRALRDELFRRYGTDTIGISKIQARVSIGRLVRKVEKCCM